MITKVANVVLNAMEGKALQLGITGVAVFMEALSAGGGNTLQPYVRVVGRLERPAEPDESRGSEDTGTNYFGVVFSKVGEMLSTAHDSGNAGRPPRKGEFGWPGGIMFVGKDNSNNYYFAFSGGTAKQDVWVAEIGAAAIGLDPEFSSK